MPKGTYPQDDVDALLKQATVLGQKLKYQFNTPSGLPAYELDLATNQIINSTFTSPLNNQTYYDINAAIAGTIILEFHRLSDLTGDPDYRTLVRNPSRGPNVKMQVETDGKDRLTRPSPIWSIPTLRPRTPASWDLSLMLQRATSSPTTLAGKAGSTASSRCVCGPKICTESRS